MARSASPDSRRDAVVLLSGMGLDPRINAVLRDLLNDPDPELQIASYEALVDRGDPFVQRYIVDGKFILDTIDSDTKVRAAMSAILARMSPKSLSGRPN